MATMDVETYSLTETNTNNTIQEYDNERDKNEGQQDETKQESSSSCRLLGLTAFNSLLQYLNWLVWEISSVN